MVEWPEVMRGLWSGRGWTVEVGSGGTEQRAVPPSQRILFRICKYKMQDFMHFYCKKLLVASNPGRGVAPWLIDIAKVQPL